MSDWQIVRFADAPFEIIDGDRGKNYPKQDEFLLDGYCLFLSATNVTKSGFLFAECQFITKEKDELLRKGKLVRGDVVLTTRGTLGNVGFYSNRIPFENVRINSGMVILRADATKLDPRFLYNYMRSANFMSQVDGLHSGVAQPQIPIKDLKAVELPLPPLPIQRRIADILSAYDDLIENNRRSIEILEETARTLYQKMFVAEAKPEWKKLPLSEVADVLYGKDHKKLGDGQIPCYGSGGIIRYCDKAIYEKPSVLIPRKGSIGNVMFVDEPFWSVDTMFYTRVKIADMERVLFYQLCDYNLASMSTGAAVPSMTTALLNPLEIIVPPDFLRESFEKVVRPLFDQKRILSRQNAKLAAARDLLLPRLMSRKLEVSS